MMNLNEKKLLSLTMALSIMATMGLTKFLFITLILMESYKFTIYRFISWRLDVNKDIIIYQLFSNKQ